MGEFDFSSKREHFRKHRGQKFFAELGLRAVLWMYAKTQGYSASEMRNPAEIAGFIEGSILDYKLCYPDETTGQLLYKQADAGRLLGFDFNRKAEFPIAAKQREIVSFSEGRLFGMCVEHVKDNPVDQRTPVDFVNIFNIDHVLTLDTYNPNELVDLELLTRKTYLTTYDEAGLATKYATDLRSRGLADEKVYQVTPKGNALLHLTPDSGDAKPKEEPESSFELATGKLHGVRII
jgi:hypothetical protein